jgi:hypothetical protein
MLFWPSSAACVVRRAHHGPNRARGRLDDHQAGLGKSAVLGDEIGDRCFQTLLQGRIQGGAHGAAKATRPELPHDVVDEVAG